MDKDLHIYPLLSQLKTQGQGFEVPEAYFDTFPELLMYRIGEKDLGFELPDDSYFQQSEQQVLAKIQRLDELSDMPLLASLPKKNVEVPLGYFEGVESRIEAGIKQPQRIFVTFKLNWSRIASVAAVLLIAFSFSRLQKPALAPSNEFQNIDLQAITDEEIIQTLVQEEIDDATLAQFVPLAEDKEALDFHDLTEEEMMEFLKQDDTF